MKIRTVALIGGMIAMAGLAEAQWTVRVCFGVTPGVRNSVGGTGNARSLLNTKYSNLRRAHDNNNSATGVSFTRPGHFNSGYNQVNHTAATQLRRLNRENQLSDFRNYRNRTNSDLGQLFCDWTNLGVLGVANQPGWASVCRRAVLTVNATNRGSGITHIHEFGHSMNASHGHGFCLNNNRRTLMRTGSCSQTFTLFFSDDRRRGGGRRLGDRTHDNRGRIQTRAPITQRQQ